MSNDLFGTIVILVNRITVTQLKDNKKELMLKNVFDCNIVT